MVLLLIIFLSYLANITEQMTQNLLRNTNVEHMKQRRDLDITYKQYTEHVIALDSLKPTCLHGKIKIVENKHICKCFEGYKGRNCDQTISICTTLNPCKNNATCIDSSFANITSEVDLYHCRCSEQFRGKNCTQEVHPCNPNPCFYSNCTKLDYKRYVCTCVGKKCGIMGKEEEEFIIIPIVGVLILIGVVVITVFVIRYCRNKSGMEGTYNPEREEQMAGTQIATINKPNTEVMI